MKLRNKLLSIIVVILFTSTSVYSLGTFIDDIYKPSGVSLSETDIKENCTGDYWNVYNDGTYVYAVGYPTGLLAYSISDGELTLLDTHLNASEEYIGITGDGDYIYVSTVATNVRVNAYSFDGSDLTFINTTETYASTFGYSDVWANDSFIFLSADDGGLVVLTFDGTSFTEVTSDYHSNSGFYQGVWSDGIYIYCGCTNNVTIYTFNGTDLTRVYEGGPGSYDVWGNGTFVYTASGSSRIRAYNFTGSSLTFLDDTGEETFTSRDVYGGEGFIVAGQGTHGIYVYTFNGTDFISVDNNDYGNCKGVYYDGDYFYNCDDGKLVVLELEYDLYDIVYVDDDADPGWYDDNHVQNIYQAMNVVNYNGTIRVYNGYYYGLTTYYGNAVEKSVSIIGNGTSDTFFTSAVDTCFYLNTSCINITDVYFYSCNNALVIGENGRDINIINTTFYNISLCIDFIGEGTLYNFNITNVTSYDSVGFFNLTNNGASVMYIDNIYCYNMSTGFMFLSDIGIDTTTISNYTSNNVTYPMFIFTDDGEIDSYDINITDCFINNSDTGMVVYGDINAVDPYYNVYIRNNSIYNSDVGLLLFNAPGSYYFNNTFYQNGNGTIVFLSNSSYLYNNYFDNINDKNVLYNQSNIYMNITKTLGTNIIGGPYQMGNYYSDYTGVDTDDDGIGETPYYPDEIPYADIIGIITEILGGAPT